MQKLGVVTEYLTLIDDATSSTGDSNVHNASCNVNYVMHLHSFLYIAVLFQFDISVKVPVTVIIF